METLEPLAGRGPALAKPAENAALGSSLDTFLMTSILDIACFALGGFSVTQVIKNPLENKPINAT